MSKVLVFPRQSLVELGDFEGYSFEPERYVVPLLRNAVFLERKVAEADAGFKQFVPYVVLYCDGAVCSYRRGSEISERRLVGKRSIGFGGHVEPADWPAGSSSPIVEAARREVSEELVIGRIAKMESVAAINSDRDEVSRVHFGILMLWTVEVMNVAAREDSIGDIKFERIPTLVSAAAEFEPWSRIALEVVSHLRPESS